MFPILEVRCVSCLLVCQPAYVFNRMWGLALELHPIQAAHKLKTCQFQTQFGTFSWKLQGELFSAPFRGEETLHKRLRDFVLQMAGRACQPQAIGFTGCGLQDKHAFQCGGAAETVMAQLEQRFPISGIQPGPRGEGRKIQIEVPAGLNGVSLFKPGFCSSQSASLRLERER